MFFRATSSSYIYLCPLIQRIRDKTASLERAFPAGSSGCPAKTTTACTYGRARRLFRRVHACRRPVTEAIILRLEALTSLQG